MQSTAIVKKTLSAATDDVTPDVNFVILVNDKPAHTASVISPSWYYNSTLTLAAGLTSLVGAAAWQGVDDSIGNDKCAIAWRCMAVGAAQTVGAFIINYPFSKFDITKKWDRWSTLNCFVGGALWVPFVSLGSLLSQLAGEDDLNSPNSIVITASTVMVCNQSMLYILKGIKYSIQQCFRDPENDNSENNAVTEEKSISFLSDTGAQVAFYLQGPVPEPGIGRGYRNVFWAALFSAGGGIFGQIATTVKNAAYDSFKKCLDKRKARVEEENEVPDTPASSHSINNSPMRTPPG